MRTALLLLVALLVASCQSAPETKMTAIVGAKLIDGRGGEPIEYSIVLIEGATFVKVGTQASIRLPKYVEIIDGMGKTIEPSSGAAIAAGLPANLKLDRRTMKDGQWQN